MGKLMTENADLNEKLAESEIYKRKFKEKNNNLEKDIASLKATNHELLQEI